MLYDGACPICTREVEMLRRKDKHDRIDFQDIQSAEFDPAAYGLTAQLVRDKLHGILPDGSVVTGMEVIRRAYRAIGLGWLWAPTGWPVLRWVFDGLYAVWAKMRPWFSKPRCDDGVCAVETDQGKS